MERSCLIFVIGEAALAGTSVPFRGPLCIDIIFEWYLFHLDSDINIKLEVPFFLWEKVSDLLENFWIRFFVFFGQKPEL